MDDPFVSAYFVTFGGIALVMTVVVILDKIEQQKKRKRREEQLDADGRSARAYRTATE